VTQALQLLVLAKAPVPGRVKTRLCPPYQPEQAARLAAAALEDVLAAVRDTPAARRVLVFDGDPALVDTTGLEVLPQVAGTLDVRLAAAFAAARGAPALLVGMDTPQLTPRMLRRAGRSLSRRDACLGLALDGGWWALGLRRPDPALLRGLPCSLPTTGPRQLSRLRRAGLSVHVLPRLRDVDVAADAEAVAAEAPCTRFATAVADMARCPSDVRLPGASHAG
jgi:rSAM/selenodomain-associated transferase 1